MSIKDPAALALPNNRINTSSTEYRVVTYMRLQRGNGANSDEVDQGQARVG